MESKTIEVPLWMPDTIEPDFHEQPLILVKIGDQEFRCVPDPGATISWVTSTEFPQKHYIDTIKSDSKFNFPQLRGIHLPSDRKLEVAPDIVHDGLRASALWMDRTFTIKSSDGEDFSIPMKIKVMGKNKFLTYDEVHYSVNYDALLALGVNKYLTSEDENWLLSACLKGMIPKFTYRCGLGHKESPTLAFGMGLKPKPNFVPRYFSIVQHDNEVPGSQWTLRVKAIIWKCKGEEEESRIDINNCTYDQKWKNNSKEKIFTSRPFSWGWFDLGYGTINFPKSLGDQDCHQYRKLMSDLKAGNLGVQAGKKSHKQIIWNPKVIVRLSCALRLY
eukprot:TRINITY_DN544_c0_g1_i4.p1 TRINITY_DN544_c0_g1~~TRINITY_DN544_c0_g1_i4.p1  ORF type:complete len:332 (-),score=36.80 TRINITY_DN544_c0_g1_i4:39-1034(-)